MTKELRRAIGYLLYHREKITSRACNFCVKVAEMEISEACKHCKAIVDKPNWKEEKKFLMRDWEARIDGQNEKDFPWEEFLTKEAIALLEKVEVKAFTADEVVEIVRRVVNAILAIPATQPLEEIVNKVFLEEGITLKKLDENLKVVEASDA